VRQEIRNADAFSICDSVRRCLVAPWTLWNHGADAPVPKMRPNTQSKPDPESRGRVYQVAAALGLSVNSDQLYSELGIEKPEDTPELLKLSALGSQLSAGLAFAGATGVSESTAADAANAVAEATPGACVLICKHDH
jgi:hypothetical protein